MGQSWNGLEGSRIPGTVGGGQTDEARSVVCLDKTAEFSLGLSFAGNLT